MKERPADVGDGGKASQINERFRGKRFTTEDFNEMQKLAGVTYYLHDKGIRRDQEKHHIIKLYVLHMEWEVPEEKHILRACILIQEDFPSFVEWFYHHTTKIEKK